MRDLEIRGAGSRLGAEQSGNMSAVGFDLFAQMLNQAVNETREGVGASGELPPALSDITVNIPGHAYLPEEYIPDADARVLWYLSLIHILPDFVQALSPWLPATHVGNAMRSAMMGTYGGDFWAQMGALALFLIPAALLGLVLRKPLEKFMEWYVEKVESSKLIS